MGDTKGSFEVEGRLIALERAQIRHSALEAARVATNRILMDKAHKRLSYGCSSISSHYSKRKQNDLRRSR